MDHGNAVEKRLVVLVVAELLPLGLVGVRDNDALIGKRTNVLGAHVGAFLRRRQQRMQHLDGCLEHLDEFKQALGGAVEAARIAVGIGVALVQVFKLADIELADQ